MAQKKAKSEVTAKPPTTASKTTTAPAPKAAAASAPKAAKPASPKASKATPKAAADTAVKADTPTATASKPAPKAAVKKPATIKLTDKQAEFLKTIHSAGETGYKGDKKAEVKAIDSLLAKKLIKKGAKDKASGAYHYTVSKAGEKHLTPTNPS